MWMSLRPHSHHVIAKYNVLLRYKVNCPHYGDSQLFFVVGFVAMAHLCHTESVQHPFKYDIAAPVAVVNLGFTPLQVMYFSRCCCCMV